MGGRRQLPGGKLSDRRPFRTPHHSATMAGLMILPSPIGVSIGSMGVGFVMTRTGKYLTASISCLVILIAGVVMFVLQDDQSPKWMIPTAFFFVGTGYGGMLTTTLLACISAVDHSQQAVITSATCKFIHSIFREIGLTNGHQKEHLHPNLRTPRQLKGCELRYGGPLRLRRAAAAGRQRCQTARRPAAGASIR